MKKNPVIRFILYALMCVLIFMYIFPVLWMVSISVKDSKEIMSASISLIPSRFTLEHYTLVFREFELGAWFKNSIITTLGITVFQVITSLLAAFGLTYYRTRLNNVLFYLLYFTMMVPFQVTMIPNYIVISKMGLVNTWLGVILPNIASVTTFYFLYQHMRDIPRTYYEAAQIDGGNAVWIFSHVALGLCGSSVSAITILTIISSWNIYFWPLLVLTQPSQATLTVALGQFTDPEFGNNWGSFMATATLSMIPVLIIYFFVQRKIIDAFVGSGLKG